MKVGVVYQDWAFLEPSQCGPSDTVGPYLWCGLIYAESLVGDYQSLGR